jgi:hypothetical protein
MVLMGLGCWVVETNESVRNSKKMEGNEGGLVLNLPILVFFLLPGDTPLGKSGFALALACELICFLVFIIK